MPVYAIVGTGIVVQSEEWMPLPEGAIGMAGERPFDNAIAQADGTWLVPEPVDISMAEADNLKTLFPVSYPGILAHIGMGDIV